MWIEPFEHARKANPFLLKATEGKPSLAPGLDGGLVPFLHVSFELHDQKHTESRPTETNCEEFFGFHVI